MKEIWKPIKGYEGYYEVSNHGRVRSLTHTDRMGRLYEGAIRKLQNASNGYKQVLLSNGEKRELKQVHRLVAETFLDNPDGLPEVNHIDENKTNNVVSNLEWCTRKYNNAYGSKPMKGERHPMRKLSTEQVEEIRKRRKAGELLKNIAADFGISMSHACAITRGYYWG